MSLDPDNQLPGEALDGQLATPREVVEWLNAQAGYAPKAGDAAVVYLTPLVVITADGGLRLG